MDPIAEAQLGTRTALMELVYETLREAGNPKIGDAYQRRAFNDAMAAADAYALAVLDEARLAFILEEMLAHATRLAAREAELAIIKQVNGALLC